MVFVASGVLIGVEFMLARVVARVLYKDDNALFINGYLGNDVISLDMIGKSIRFLNKNEEERIWRNII